MGTKSRADETTAKQPTNARRVGAQTMKWIGGATVILSLVFGLQQLGSSITESRKRHQQIEQALVAAQSQEDAGDFAAAWGTLDKAAQAAGAERELQVAQADLAMRWLETRRGADVQTFDANKLLPVLVRAAATAAGARKADLLAHVGWAQGLRSYENDFRSQATAYYDQAIQAEPQNAYAHAMQAYGVLLRAGPNEAEIEHALEYSRREFGISLATGRGHDFVRELQLGALCGHEDLREGKYPRVDAECLAVLNGMRVAQETLSAQVLETTLTLYSRRLAPHIEFTFYSRRHAPSVDDNTEKVVESPALRSFLGASSPADHLATFSWLFDRAAIDPSKNYMKEYFRATLLEAAAQPAEALKTLQKARTGVPDGDYSFRVAFDDRIRRLSKAPHAR